MLIQPKDHSLVKIVHSETFTNDGHLILASLTEVGMLRVSAVDPDMNTIFETAGGIITARRTLITQLAEFKPKRVGIFSSILKIPK